MALAVGAAIGTPVTAQNPARVVAPFQVVDKQGHMVFQAAVSPDGVPTGYFYDISGDIAAAIGAKPGTPTIQLLKGGNYRGGLGVAQGGNGLLELLGKTGVSENQRVHIIGAQGLIVYNYAGKEVASVGMDDHSQGYAVVNNGTGVHMASLAVAQDGSGGRVSVLKPGSITVLMGVLENGKGDVCANGAPNRQVCLSGLALKNFIPY